MAYRGESWRLVLLGKTGVGKSATGNTILGEKVFMSETRASSVTTYCSKQTRVVDGKSIILIDTPGLYDTKMTNEFIVNECAKGIRMVSPGPHAFLLVIDVKRFTAEERNTVREFQKVFGEGVHNHMIILFTRGDDLEYDNKTIEDFIGEAGPDLRYLISSCGSRYHVLNNRTKDRTQVKALFRKIQTMLSLNDNRFYSFELFTMEREIEELKRKMQDLQHKHRTRCLLL